MKNWATHDWASENIDYIMVRKDLPDWPAAGKVDGSAHIDGDRGLVFLFNPNKKPLPGEFALTESSIGLKGDGLFEIRQEYPDTNQTGRVRYGEVVKWRVPPESAVLLYVKKLQDTQM